ncbi:hypothetical protein [Cyanobium sp. CH-040]|uniref:hypothetical protein n=1 Tax=Cyanobium sp. CH-040 TaxID=2823708 RepID=UPI0020CE399D|nr:hypothetical protein [Cyanobium sp. CH-040]MCP9927592.1 hypothetical protein [Cyanobium sp. CH-040]
MRRRPDGVWICQHCGASLKRRRGVGPLALLVGGLAALGFGLTVLPPAAEVQRRLTGLELPAVHDLPLLLDAPPQLAALLPPPGPGGLEGIDEPTLMDQLARADAAWIPRAEPLPDGRTRYHYKRRSGDPQLSVAEIRSLMLNPPSFGQEREAIRELLADLVGVGVRIQLSQPLKRGAAGEWDPRERSLRIKPTVLQSGSAEFFQVLNHEAIHVAQSCSSGHLRASPRPLGLSEQVPSALQPVLNDPLYSQASLLERQLEREAYANQHRLGYGAELLRRHCRPAAGSAALGLASP